MRIWRASIVLAAALSLMSAACTTDGDEGETEAFSLSGRVVAVEPAAQPATDRTDVDVTGAVVVRADAPEGCQPDANGMRVYVEPNTAFTPTSASGDLEELDGETVDVRGTMTKDGDECTLFAESVSAEDADESTGGDAEDGSTGDAGTDSDGGTDGDGGGGAGSTARPGGTSAPGATGSPGDLDDAGSITDPDVSPGPDEDGR